MITFSDRTQRHHALVRRSKALIDELQGALRELAHLADPEAGEVRLGAMETLQAGLVAAAIRMQLRRYPRTRFILESGQSPDLIGHFLPQRLVDFVVARPLTTPLPHRTATVGDADHGDQAARAHTEHCERGLSRDLA